jgi:hypothetical protein
MSARANYPQPRYILVVKGKAFLLARKSPGDRTEYLVIGSISNLDTARRIVEALNAAE